MNNRDVMRCNVHELKVDNLVKTIKNHEIVRGISMELRTGEVVGLLGPNGAGKTTTFYMICGLIEATEGKVYIDGVDVSNLPLHKRSRMGIGYLPQEASIFKDLSVEENLVIAAQAGKLDKATYEQRIEELLEMFNIEPIRNRRGINLSGGERRRAEIARALVNKPRFLLLDEPFAGVDPIAVMDIQSVIRQLALYGIGVLITDHNVRETLAVCDRAYVIKSGSLLASGTSHEIAHNPDVRQHYLGESFKF
jgi:lipopolysaccharide export system ATP-binding protein